MVEKPADVQSERPQHRIPVDWVTVSNLRLPVVNLVSNGLEFASVPVISAAVALPADQRGIHASRTYEAVSSVVHELRANLNGVSPTSQMARRLLYLHNYGTASKVIIRGQAFLLEKTPVSAADSYQLFEIILRSDALRKGEEIKVRDFTGVKVAGMTACPCAKLVIRDVYGDGERSSGLPLGTHMQRAKASVLVEGFDHTRVIELVQLVRNSFSNGTVEYLKRLDEAKLVVDAIGNPRFVEDVAREIVYKIVARFRNIPDHNIISVNVKSFESIHDHDMEARIRTRFGEARRSLDIGLAAPEMA